MCFYVEAIKMHITICEDLFTAGSSNCLQINEKGRGDIFFRESINFNSAIIYDNNKNNVTLRESTDFF